MANNSVERSLEEIRCFIKISILCGKPTSEIIKTLDSYPGGSPLAKTAIYEWAKRFKEGRATVEDNPRTGRPADATDDVHVEAVAREIGQDPRSTCEQIAETLQISSASVHRILTEKLLKRKVVAKFVPHFLSDDQKDTRVRMCRANFSRYRKEGFPFLNRLVATDETWAHCYEPELKRQSAEWQSPGEPRPQKVRQGPTTLKQMWIFAYSNKRILLAHPVPPNTTVNKEYYREFLVKLHRAISDKQPDLLAAGVVLLHDNATCHKAQLVQSQLEAFQWEELPHPPYSPDLSPCDFDLFPILKEPLRGQRFRTLQDLGTAVTERARELDKGGLCRGIERLPDRWTKAMEKEGDYFE